MFRDRYQAGKLLANELRSFAGKNIYVVAIPRGGVIVGKAISKELNVPLDVVITRKLGAPHHSELAIGAVGPNDTVVLNQDIIQELGVDLKYLKNEIEKQGKVIKERNDKYSLGKQPLRLRRKTVILVDDGIATGATVEAAIQYLRNIEVKRIVLAVPVAPKASIDEFKKRVDKLIVLQAPEDFRAVGDYYESFPQVSDEEVIQLLQRCN